MNGSKGEQIGVSAAPTCKSVFFPTRHGDFSNLEELRKILAASEPPTVVTGFTTGESVPLQTKCPHAIIFNPDSEHSYDFVKLDENTYLLKVIKAIPNRK